MLTELHEGICGNHPGGRTLVHRAHTQGYYWPTMKFDTVDHVRKCDHCQRQAPILRPPAQDLMSILSPWPFAQWGIDIVGSLPTALAQKKLLLVATHYFSKWIEAEASHQLETKRSLNSSRKISFVSSVFPEQSYQTMGPNLIAGSIETYVRN